MLKRALRLAALFCCLAVAGFANESSLQTPLDLNDPRFTIGTVTGSASEPKADASLYRAAKKRFVKVGDAILALKHGSIDAVVYNGAILDTALAESPQVLRILDEPLDYSDMCMALSPRTAHVRLRDELEAFVSARTADGALAELYRRWAEDRDCAMPDLPEVEAPVGTLRVGTQGTLPPLSFYRGDRLVGSNIELILRFAQEYRYAVEFRVEDLTAQLNDAEFGKIDLLDGSLYYTEERAQKVDFIRTPLQRTPVSVMVLADAGHRRGFFEGVLASAEKTFLREDRWRMILSGLKTTLLISAGTLILGTLLGFLFCLIKRSRFWPLPALMNGFIALIDGTPIVLTLMICFYIVFDGTGLGEVAVAIIAFSVDFGCRAAMTLDSGLNAVPLGEVEAANVMGFKPLQTFIEIQLPQAVAHVFPLYKSQVAAMIKSTSIVGYISVQDLTRASDIIRSRTYEAFFSLVMTALIYFLIARACLMLLGWIGNRVDRRRRRRGDVLRGIDLKDIDAKLAAQAAGRQ